MGDDGKGYSTLAELLPQSASRSRMSARKPNADRVHLPPTAVKEARNLQNFFSCPRQEEKEEGFDQKKERKTKYDLPTSPRIAEQDA